LFHNTAKADLDKTIAKLDMLNSMNTVIRSGGDDAYDTTTRSV
jgi:hypothetical protein